jgi:hypothetical protein
MQEVTTEEFRLRQFLLGQLDEAEREELEQLVLSEGGTREKLLMAEDDLIEEYLEGSLAGDERDKFLRQFLSIPHQRDKLRMAKSLRRLARAQTVEAQPPADKPLLLADVRVFPGRRKFLLYAPIAAMLVVAVTAGAIWYANYRRTVERERQRQAIENELAQLNGPNAQNPPADQISSLIVPAVAPRSVTASSSSTLQRPILELWLPPGPKQTERYSALLHRFGSDDKFEIPNLQLQDLSGNKAVRLRIFTRHLTRGTYRVQLNGLSPDGTVVETEEYSLEIQ